MKKRQLEGVVQWRGRLGRALMVYGRKEGWGLGVCVLEEARGSKRSHSVHVEHNGCVKLQQRTKMSGCELGIRASALRPTGYFDCLVQI